MTEQYDPIKELKFLLQVKPILPHVAWVHWFKNLSPEDQVVVTNYVREQIEPLLEAFAGIQESFLDLGASLAEGIASEVTNDSTD